MNHTENPFVHLPWLFHTAPLYVLGMWTWGAR
jgi:hypothetical protein